tara:strand:+ start:63 stop:1538 length:1476 start_codon:yes stop_codon:yes gene_type:complete
MTKQTKFFIYFPIFILLSISLPSSQSPTFQKDIKQLSIFKTAFESMFSEMMKQQEETTRHKTGYITNTENDRIENLLFRYLILRNSTWEIINKYRGYQTFSENPQDNMKAFVIGYSASLILYKYSGLLITTYLNDDQMVNKLNESYYRSKIPKETFNNVFSNLTNPQNLEDLDVARELYMRELRVTGTPLNRLYNDPMYKVFLDELEELHQVHTKLRETIFKQSRILSADLENRLRHSEIKKKVDGLIETTGGLLAAIRAFVMTQVGDLKSPVYEALSFSQAEKEQVISQLKTGDIILTFSEGYLSNIFLPGVFTHSIIYVGTRNSWSTKDWDALNLTPAQRSMISPEDDIIEALSEGVVSGTIDHILDSKINRMVVFRPLLKPEEMKSAIKEAHAYLGNEYDFSFDINDASKQICTEIIYRAFNGKNNIRFDLVSRIGTMTLNADDIGKAALKSESMEFLMLVVEDNYRPGHARISRGKPGLEKIKELLN